MGQHVGHYQAGGGEIYQKVMSALYGGEYVKKGTLGGIFKKRKNCWDSEYRYTRTYKAYQR